MYICLKHTAKSILVNFMPTRTKDRGIVNFVCPVVCLCVCPSVCLSVRLFVCLWWGSVSLCLSVIVTCMYKTMGCLVSDWKRKHQQTNKNPPPKKKKNVCIIVFITVLFSIICSVGIRILLISYCIIITCTCVKSICPENVVNIIY